MRPQLFTDADIVVITGHYGSGKTNLTSNLALALAHERPVTVIDLDIVNPYFRISDSTEAFAAAGVEMIAPVFAGTALDTPSLGPAIDNAIRAAGTGGGLVLIDVGGDPDGAVALGRYRKLIAEKRYEMVYLLNQRRYLSSEAEQAVELMREIEQASGLPATCLAGNTHLKGQTTASTVLDSLTFVEECARLTGLPVAFVTAPSEVSDEVGRRMGERCGCDAPDLLPVDVHVKTPWE